MEYRIISGDKIKHFRGSRSLRDVANSAEKRFSAAALYKWEQGKAQPRREILPSLLSVLGCNYEDISEAVDLGVGE